MAAPSEAAAGSVALGLARCVFLRDVGFAVRVGREEQKSLALEPIAADNRIRAL